MSRFLKLAPVGRAVLAGLLIATAVATGGAAPASPPEGFIVVLHDNVANPGAVAREHTARFGGQITYVYEHALKGYAVQGPTGLAAGVSGVSGDARVAYVERDGEMRISTTQGPPSNPPVTWGLDRIDQRPLALSGTYTYTNTGTGVTAYIIDTGILTTHSEFGPRAMNGFDAVDGALPALDCNGHGTHVAGTVGGATYGVAKGVTLVAVRVLNCSGSGTTSGVIAGIDWVTADHKPGGSRAGQPAVANMSLGGGASSSLDTAVRNSIAGGVSYAIAAGNGNIVGIAQDACKSSPARVSDAMTIGATDKADKKASWSNYGSCIDWFAPGVSITSAWWDSNSATKTISGTSMATPHTAGVAALYLQTNPGALPSVVRNALFAQATNGVVTSSKTVNNHLLFTSY